MTDPEIKQYLDKNNWAVNAQECILKVFNTSSQIVNTEYNFDTGMMTIRTPENSFTFRWLLRKL